MLDDLRMFPSYAIGLARYLRSPLTLDECRLRIRDTYAGRDGNFLHLLEHAVYRHLRSPYRALLDRAGVELGDVAALVRADGVEGALDRLYEEGVHLTLDELRSRVPVRRGSLEFTFAFGDLANPLVKGALAGRTGASRSLGRTVLLNFEYFRHQAAYAGAWLSAFGLAQRPSALWYPPVMPGISFVLAEVKLGRKPERWFLPSPLVRGAGSVKEGVLIATAWGVSRVERARIPYPRHLPPARAVEIATWLANKRRAGTPGLLAASPSSVVRVCVAASEHGLDVSGSFFRMGAEPYTQAKAKIIAAAGCSGACHYFMSELGWLGIACANPTEVGDVHLTTDRIAVRQRSRRLVSGETVPLLAFTSLHRSLPTVLINVETDDFGVLEPRECGCELAALGFSLHLHTIRSVEKLTGEGVSFLGESLIDLVEDVLPRRFGGTPNDYQLVEREREGLTRVQVRISPRLDRIDEAAVVPEILAYLERSGREGRAMAALWRDGLTLEVARAEPIATRASKVLPLHRSPD